MHENCRMAAPRQRRTLLQCPLTQTSARMLAEPDLAQSTMMACWAETPSSRAHQPQRLWLESPWRAAVAAVVAGTHPFQAWLFILCRRISNSSRVVVFRPKFWTLLLV